MRARFLLAVMLLGAGASAAPPPPAKLSTFSLGDVRLLDGPFQHAAELNRAWLLSLEPDRFLYHCRRNAGLPTTVQPYGGWEAPDWDFAGHTLGHYLSACSLMFASTGEPEFKRRIDHMVAVLAECQAALAKRASHAGFLDPLPESVFEKLESGAGGVGVPFYTMHKTMSGLLDAHTLGGNAQALDVLKGLAAWLQFRLDRLSTGQIQTMLRIEHGGINESMASLYAITKDPDHLRLAEKLNHRLLFEPMARGEDPLGPGPGADRLLHGNTQVPKALGAAREYELTGNPAYRTVATNFWNSVVQNHTWIFGGNTDAERFFARGTWSQHLTPTTGEGCNTYNMLKLTEHLFAWAPSAAAMDFYERALFNHILATQNPHDGRIIYFMSLQPGFRKLYGSRENTFWCCTGSGMENHAKYGGMIYAHDDRSLFVNLFIPSELRWAERRLTLRQETRFPDEDQTRLLIRTNQPQRLALKIRYPGWSGPIEVSINGGRQRSDASPSSYVTLEREWHDGDQVSVRLPMSLRAVPLPDDVAQVAFMFGPLVLAGQLGRDGLQFKATEFVDNGKDRRGPRPPEEPVLVPGLITTATEAVAHLRPVAGQPLTFRTEGIGRPNDVTLVPLHRIVDENYTVYWKLCDEAGWKKFIARAGPKEAERRAAQARIVDAVWTGHAGTEDAHAVHADAAPVVSSRMSLFRDATHGSVSWKLQAAPGERMTLKVGYVGTATTAFDLFVGGQKIAEEPFDRELPEIAGMENVYCTPGGIAEAVLRAGRSLLSQKTNVALDMKFTGTEKEGVRTASVQLDRFTVKAVTVTGLPAAVSCFDAMKAGNNEVAFLEILACPMGCISGGGQPKVLLPQDKESTYAERAKLDSGAGVEGLESITNHPAIRSMYQEYFRKPCGDRTNRVLHTQYIERKLS